MNWTLEVVVVPVSDLDRAKAFYADQLGFSVDHDTVAGEGMRIIQLTPPGSGCSVVIGTGVAKMAPGSLQGLQLVVNDIAAAHAQLAERGVAVSPVQHFEGAGLVDGPGGRYNSFIFFQDPDGNGWTVQEMSDRP